MGKGFEREVRDFLGPRGPLSGLLARYEERPEQAALAQAALRAMERDGVLVVEAGTGTGKTLAYLVPAIYSARKVVISTGTKALQEQLIHKDLPVLSQAFKVFATVMKGRANYLCWRRFHEFCRAPEFGFRDEVSVWDRIREWAPKTDTGDRAEIKSLPDNYGAWRELSSTGEQCRGQKCEYNEQCFVARMRLRGQAADIVIVNHHLFFADLALKGDANASVLPEYSTVIFDEAHALAETATEFFGLAVSTWRAADLGQDVRRLQRLGGMKVDALRTMVHALERAEDPVFNVLKMFGDNGGGRGEDRGGGSRFFLAPWKNRGELIEETERAQAELKLLAKTLTEIDPKDDGLVSLAGRAGSLAEDLGFILAMKDPEHVYWGETRGRGVILRASPAELGPILADRLFSQDFPIIFTSATLAVQVNRRWSFDHFSREVGLDLAGRDAAELHLASSYNWAEQAMLYVPSHLPEPMEPGYIREAAREMLKILRVSRGRAFLLFTSYRNLEGAYELLAPHLDFPVLKQGDAPKAAILEEFRAVEDSVLFATQSFWEGVDVAGRALSCVIIDKLPFAAPTDPLMSARIDRIKRKGGNAFNDYQLPAAVIALKQGLGRLIRARDDYGILAVLDSRLHHKSYGKTFLASLPPAPVTTRIEDLKEFMKKHEGEGEGGEEEKTQRRGDAETQRRKKP